MLNLPLLALGAVGVVSVVGHVVGPRLAELIAAVEAGDLVKAARASTRACCRSSPASWARTPRRHHDQGGLQLLGLLGPPRRGRRSSTPPTDEVAALRADLAAAASPL